ncbi:MAG: hypothetical protein LBI45_05435 [Bacteroidales bacterium]|jgi:hypothetical protein|nr:hypothetical protein [Bacteroidales bacterium]
MKKGTKFLFSVVTALLFAVSLGSVFGTPVGIGAFAASTFIKAPAGSLRMAVAPEIWTDYIIGNLFKGNEFLLDSVDESQYVIGGTLVHIPQAGSVSGVKRNRESLPATIKRRKDIDITYALDELTTDPRFIPYADTVELSYDKMDSCMTEDMAALKQFAAESMLYNWKPTYYIKASGTALAGNLVYGTGKRTGLTVADFAKAKAIFNKWNIDKADRYVILSTEMYEQLCAELRESNDKNIGGIYDPVSGRLVKLEGFTIYERSTTLLASKDTLTSVSGIAGLFKWTGADLLYTPEEMIAIETEAAVAATTTCVVGLFWSKTWVARAIGSTQMFENTGDPTYYGDIYSFLQRIGGRARRADGKGVLGIIQATAA